MSTVYKVFTALFFISVLSACVTTTDSRLTRNANQSEAVEKYVQLGLEYIKREDYSRAKKRLLRALELDEDNTPANAALGLIYHNDGDNKIAEEYFLSAIDDDPKYTRGRTYYGAFLFSEQRYQEALQQFQLAAEDTEYASRSQVYTNIALCNLKLGRQDDAQAAYEKTLKLDRMNGRALSGVTELLLEKDDFERANYYYGRLVRLITENGLRHSPQSLWQGIRIARYYGSEEQEAGYSALLVELYPESSEYAHYLSSQ